MKLVIFEDDRVENFYPLTLSRAVFELRCGIDSLGEKIARWAGRTADAVVVREYLSATLQARTAAKVNDLAGLDGGPVLFVNGRVLVPGDAPAPAEPGAYYGPDGALCWLLTDKQVAQIRSYEQLRSLAEAEPRRQCHCEPFNYIWEVMLASGEQITRDFAALGRSGVEGTIEQPSAIRGSSSQLYVGPAAVVQPMVVIDTTGGPVYLDEAVQVHPFTRIEGPAYVGPGSTLLGTKLRAGCSIGPVCRVGGEVEETVIQGYSNKYHDGFLGHAYVGEWVNLGAQTSNSDLKNDYSPVEVILNGRKINTGSTKVGSIIGDHTKTSIGTLLNTGAVVGAMTVIVSNGELLPKSVPSFAWLINGVVTRGFGRGKLYETARVAMSRRNKTWSEADQALWEQVYELTRPEREEALARGRRQTAGLRAR